MTLCPWLVTFLYHMSESPLPLAPAAQRETPKGFSGTASRRYCGHHDTILISNILTSCSIMGRRVVTHEKIESLVLRKGLRAVRIIWLAWARPLSLQLFCLSPPCFNYSLIWLQAEMKDNCPFDDGARYKNKWECFSRTHGYSTFAVSSTRHIKTECWRRARTHTSHKDRASHRENSLSCCDPWPYFTRPCARQQRRLNFIHRVIFPVWPRINVCNASV